MKKLTNKKLIKKAVKKAVKKATKKFADQQRKNLKNILQKNIDNLPDLSHPNLRTPDLTRQDLVQAKNVKFYRCTKEPIYITNLKKKR